jgi:cytochrome c-type biogenesis protein CcmH/NrfF
MNDTFMTTFIASNGMEDSNSPEIIKNLNCHNCKNNDIEYFK